MESWLVYLRFEVQVLYNQAEELYVHIESSVSLSKNPPFLYSCVYCVLDVSSVSTLSDF